ncbi:uncharacterized protein C8Q71DRAFT_765306 [Rhodofomes roseus]|uniref:F-box domain-containing protein n=1 Tax=Rhodofomes roseus TaxID=34475 RepID=A0ABQ8KCX4_9APHY|nr:uncharacterized protein C8Q71DRAFT_765306 [Rhodofomes roseus]KAH9835341.1 hypothetical protein C8Q71DRAFT_765306 [Rhodofomes roseus]
MEARTLRLVLPPELWDHVVDNLSSDRPSLGACGLTQRAWVASTRRHLFHDIILKGTARCEQFRELIIASSSTGTGIARYVCDVMLKDVCLHVHVSRLEYPNTSDVPLLEKTLSLLPNVDCLCLWDVDVQWWEVLTARTGDALDGGYPDLPLQSLFTLPRLQTLYVSPCVAFDSLSDLVLLLAAFPQASSLQLHDLSVKHPGPARWPPLLPWNRNVDHESLICIRNLCVTTFREMARLRSALRQPPFRCALQKLSWTFRPIHFVEPEEDVDTLMDVLRDAESTLEELKIICIAQSNFDVFPALSTRMDLSLQSRLRILRVHLLYAMEATSNPYQMSFPVCLSRTPTSLRALHLDIQLSTSPDNTTLPPLDWSSLDDTLTLLHKKNPSLVVYMRFDYGLLRQNGRLPEAAQPLRSQISSALRVGLRVRLVVGGYTCGRGHSVLQDKLYWL